MPRVCAAKAREGDVRETSMPPGQDALGRHAFRAGGRASGRGSARRSPAGARRSPSRTASRPPGARARRSAPARLARRAPSPRHVGVAPHTTHGREHVSRRAFRALALTASALCLMAVAASAADASKVFVSNSAPAVAGGKSCAEPGFNTVQAAVTSGAHADRSVLGHLHRTGRQSPGPRRSMPSNGVGTATLAMPETPARSESACDTKSNEAEGPLDQSDEISICTSATVTLTGIAVEAVIPLETCANGLNGIFIGGGGTLKATHVAIDGAEHERCSLQGLPARHRRAGRLGQPRRGRSRGAEARTRSAAMRRTGRRSAAPARRCRSRARRSPAKAPRPTSPRTGSRSPSAAWAPCRARRSAATSATWKRAVRRRARPPACSSTKPRRARS